MKVFARGLNFMGQLGLENGYQNVNKFTEIQQLAGRNVKQIESHFTQSYCLLDDGQLLNWGYVLDSLTTTRVLNYHVKSPKFTKLWQKYAPVGKTLGLRLGSEQMNLLNSDLVLKVQPKQFTVGGSFILFWTADGRVYGTGENYKGQLGTGNTKFQFQCQPIQFQSKEKILQVSAGFQHTLYLTESGQLYGSGRANWNQIVPLIGNSQEKQTNALIDYYVNPMRMRIQNEHIIKVATGFHHSIFLCQSGNLYSLGFNNKGQCGTSNLNRVDCDEFQRVYCNLDSDEHIVDIASGKSHNIFYTNKNVVYMFGSAQYLQMGREQEFDIDLCSPTEVELNLGKDEKIIKIKANFDRSAVITNKGNCYIWGGQNQEELCGENHNQIEKINVNEYIELNQQNKQLSQIVDVGLGYLHTLVLTSNN